MRHRVFVFVFVVLGMSACDQQDGSHSSAGPGDSSISVALPEAIRSEGLPPEGFSAIVSSNCMVGGSLTRDGSNFSGTFRDVDEGDCTFTITFMYDSVFGLVELATASLTINIVRGQTNTVAFDQGDFVLPDTDGDGDSNLAEIGVDRNPFASVWGQFNWGGQQQWSAIP